MKKYYCDACGKEIDIPRQFKTKIHIQEMFENKFSSYVDNEGNGSSGLDIEFDLCQKCYNEVMLKAYTEFRNINDKSELDKLKEIGL